MATKDIRDRLYTILDALTPVSGSYVTIAPRVPRAMQDYEGYVVVIDLSATTGRRLSRELREEVQTWRVRLYSPSLGTGHDAVREDRMYDYRDVVVDALESNQTLQASTTHRGLANVSGVSIVSDRFSSPVEWGGQYRALWECTLSVTVTRQTTC